MSKAIRVTVTPWRLRHLWRGRRNGRLFGSYVAWGSEGGAYHTECRHYRLGPVVLHVYTVRP